MDPRSTRRRFVTGAAALAGGLALGTRSRAQDQSTSSNPPRNTNLRDGEILPSPDFDLLREENPYVVGVRPYRPGGVRLELVDAPLPGQSGPKYLIHNYGHGGAGITLSWGCASVVVDRVEEAMAKLESAKWPPTLAVLGTGMVGLTAATEIRRRWPQLPITVYAKDLDLRTTVSWVAAGQFEPSGMHRLYRTPDQRKVLHDYVRRSARRVAGLQESGHRHGYGVAVRKNYTLDRDVPAFSEAVPRDVVAAPRRGRLPFEHLNGMGREYQTWLVNPMIMMPKLAEDLRAADVKFEARQFDSLKDVSDLAQSLIVNCTGYGAKRLFNDDTLIAQRGHNVVLKKTDQRQFYFFSGGCENSVIAYVFCRQTDIVVGGTIQKGQEDSAPGPADDPIFARLLANGRQLFAGHPAACRAS